MLCAFSKLHNREVRADAINANHAPFFCRDCNQEVVLKLGSVRVPHFAHKNPESCPYASGETDAHRKCKLEIYNALLKEPGVAKVALERSLKTARPDVSAYIHGVPVAIEVQISSLSIETIIRRTSEYARKGIYVLWLLQWTPYVDGYRYAPRLWEKWIHEAYFGNVYYWQGGLNIACYRFDDYFEATARNLANQKRSRISSSPKPSQSKRFRIPTRASILNLVKDFTARNRRAWTGSGFVVPGSKLFAHRDEMRAAEKNQDLRQR